MRDDFLDTNVLIYAADDPGPKADVADALIRSGGVVSVQVLNEFVSVARSKMRLEWPPIIRFLDGVCTFLTVRPLTLDTHRRARSVAEVTGYAIYDATIVAAALEAGCARLVSEDLQAGREIDGRLTIRNPFA